MIRLGAIRVVVTGTLPEGCCPIFLAAFPNSDPKAYDDKGCLRDLNEFQMSHNNNLKGKEL